MQPDSKDFFSVPCRPGMLRTLQGCLRPQSSADCHISFEGFHVDLEPTSAAIESEGVADAASFGEAVREILFFHVVRGSPNSLVRVIVDGESGFDAADIIIAPHRTLHVKGHSRGVIVDSVALEWLNHSEKQLFVLSLASFSCEELASICKWKPVSGVLRRQRSSRLQLVLRTSFHKYSKSFCLQVRTMGSKSMLESLACMHGGRACLL